MTAYDITLLTETRFPDLTPDDLLLRRALERRGISVRVAIWNDPSVDWTRSPHTVFRSTWDYFHRYDEFQAWIDAVETQTRLVNSASTVRWNMHKRYLGDLAQRGVPVVPTIFVDKGEPIDLAANCRDRGFVASVVIKPCVAGSSFGAKRFDLETEADSAKAHLDALVGERDAMIQEYLPSVETKLERSLIFFDGEFSHAVFKNAFEAYVGDENRTHVPSEFEIDAARRVIASVDEHLLYARVDMAYSEAELLLMELELIEPGLFFGTFPSAADRFADVLAELR